ncbi:DUF4377 domain-containing protein [Polaribacter sp. SA4-12]|uniref:DUF4377 domain-containing protein n=1 Tax=Polaribacter sp. SA4-12 TaxID=1312072 RepID=UPI000B582B9B|nr:DUF4377 domain-containing protein [Polaribacter sp. SA4-12]ARV15882.1 hypothetical protein BTO07_12350 [Polaribacter sp. SA4-12]
MKLFYMVIKRVILVFLFLSTIVSCEQNNDDLNQTRIIVASQTIDCQGIAAQKCLLIREVDNENWEYFYDSIIGFNYEEGFEYEILISEKEIENPPQDASSIEYTLIEVISKTEKISKNLPN